MNVIFNTQQYKPFNPSRKNKRFRRYSKDVFISLQEIANKLLKRRSRAKLAKQERLKQYRLKK